MPCCSEECSRGWIQAICAQPEKATCIFKHAGRAKELRATGVTSARLSNDLGFDRNGNVQWTTTFTTPT